MKYLRKYFYISTLLLLLLFAKNVFASIEITEIMYDVAPSVGNASSSDTDREWIEIHNNGTTDVDLSTWYTYDTSHHILHPDGISKIVSLGYAVVVQDVNKFKTDWPNFVGSIFQSNFASLSNTGDIIKIKDNNGKDGNIADSITYTASLGGAEDGNSLQKINGIFVGAIPTPGIENQASVSNNNQNTNNINVNATPQGGGNSTTLIPVKTKEVPVPKITTEVIVKNIVVAGIDFPISDLTLGLSKETLNKGKFIWNFGDGRVIEERESKNFEYRYEYPGEYVLSLSYFDNFYSSKPIATDRVIIKVIPSDISISSVGNTNDPFVEIENKSSYEFSLSRWVLKGTNHTFIIPEGTSFLPGKKLKFSSHITNFDISDINQVSLTYPSGEIVSLYPILNSQPIFKNSHLNNNKVKSFKELNVSKSLDSDVIDLDTLSASS